MTRYFHIAQLIFRYISLNLDYIRRFATKTNSQPHVDLWRHLNVKMTSPCRMYVAFQRIQAFLEAIYSCFPMQNEVFSGDQVK